jgi:hypothetical protein
MPPDDNRAAPWLPVHAVEAESFQIEFIDKNLNDADWIIV